MTNSITTTNSQGQTVSQVPGQPGTVTTGRPERTEIHNPVTADPFAGIPGAYGDEPVNPANETTYGRTEAAVYLGIVPSAVDMLVTREILGVCRDYAHEGELRHTRAHLDAYVARGQYCSGILPEGYDHEARMAAARRIAEQRALIYGDQEVSR